MASDYWIFVSDFVNRLFSFVTPWGIAFGSVVVGIFGLPLVVKAIKKNGNYSSNDSNNVIRQPAIKDSKIYIGKDTRNSFNGIFDPVNNTV